jgi:hypothetical protein
MSVQASQRLVQLFNVFASPTILLADEQNHKLLGYLVETLDNIVRFHFRDNANLMYALVRSQKKIALLKDFTLAKVVVERKARSRSNSTNDPPAERKQRRSINIAPVGTSLSDEEDEIVDDLTVEISDKARGKLPDYAQQPSTSTANSAFAPTEDWVSTWQPGLKLATLISVLDLVTPKIETLCAANPLTTDQQVLRYLSSDQVFQALPSMPDTEKTPRGKRFHVSTAVRSWLNSVLWSHIYVTGREPLGIWNSTAVRLFQVGTIKKP